MKQNTIFNADFFGRFHFRSELPQHLDGVDDADVGVAGADLMN
jgi:hypothetical protein